LTADLHLDELDPSCFVGQRSGVKESSEGYIHRRRPFLDPHRDQVTDTQPLVRHEIDRVGFPALLFHASSVIRHQRNG